MNKVPSVRRMARAVLVAFCGVLLFAAAAQAESKTWNVASEFPLTKQNPAPDRYGNSNVWYFTYGRAAKRKYKDMSFYFGAEEEKAACGSKEFYGWDKENRVNGTPAIWYNAGPTVERGENIRAPYATFPTKTVFMHPQYRGAANAVVQWKSPVTGVVSVSGSVEPVDTFVTGIAWQLDKGTAVVLGPTELHEDVLTSFGRTSISVIAGEYLNLEIGRARGARGSSDSTAVTLTITSS
jgi:hypothetical protein